jgi:hypothetical protein
MHFLFKAFLLQLLFLLCGSYFCSLFHDQSVLLWHKWMMELAAPAISIANIGLKMRLLHQHHGIDHHLFRMTIVSKPTAFFSEQVESK